jgi:two-component system LytT family response regulator
LKSLRALVIDDEAPARKKLTMFLSQEPDVEVVGQASNGFDAIAAIEEHRPDVVFLDIQMPGMNGFEVLDALGTEDLPIVVFVTAYDEHAVKAFEVHALDYLLKPFDRSRLQDCLTRVRRQRQSDNAGIEAVLAEFRPKDYLTRIAVKARGRVLLLKTDEIEWIEACGNYVELHSRKQSYLLRKTLNALYGKLDPRQFVRVHRSTMVNLDRIQELQPWSHGDFIVVLKDGTQLRMSRRYRQNLDEFKTTEARRHRESRH